MFCIFCGTQIPDNAKFCHYCGAQITIDENSLNVTSDNVSNEQTEIANEEISTSKTNDSTASVTRSAINKMTILISAITLLLGAVVSGIIVRNVSLKEVYSLKREAKAEKEELEEKKKDIDKTQKDADKALKDASKALEDAQKKYDEISNIEVINSEPKTTYLQGVCVVGVDIAPGMYSMKSKGTDYVCAYRYRYGEENGDLILNGYGDEELGEVILKAGEKLDIPDGIVTFTPTE